MRAIAALGALGALLPLAVAGAQQRSRFGGDYPSRIDTTVAFDAHGSVSLSAPSGDIHVRGATDGKLHVQAESDDDNLRLDVTGSHATLDLAGGSRGSDAKFEVEVPVGVRVVARTQSGDIEIRGTRGEVEAHTQNGDITIDGVTTRLDVNTFSGDVTVGNVAGDVEIGTINGDVHATDLRGDVDVTAVSGDIELRGVTARIVRAKTTSGDVTFDGTIDPNGRYELTSHSGDVNLHVPRDASAQLSISTWNGAVDSDFPITLKPGEHGIGIANAKNFTFQIGGGAARITAETFSGDISISSNGRGAR
ncbi:MAG TPA: DUF4097 family beta strand repeat-containing protein [Gemmatimonadaceae bacterium]|nr:DUF4097 family beta strand repeat-containing protein [Gemmatimonadaceae bacterium]